MPFPNLEGKHAFDSFFSPIDFIEFDKRRGTWQEFPIPMGVVLTYSPHLFERILLEAGDAVRGPFVAGCHLVGTEAGLIGLTGKFGIGAPAASTVMEELIAAGVTRFVSIGGAGGLQPDLRIGDITLCERAIRDEGVSHHYLPSETYADCTGPLTDRLREALAVGLPLGEVRAGTTWTIDAPYRETVQELRYYQAQGVLTVEMEAAALAAVARYRGVEFATAFTVTDSLAEAVWNPQFGSEAITRGMDLLYRAAVGALAGR
jgi:purine-nucleoside phosphorylase